MRIFLLKVECLKRIGIVRERERVIERGPWSKKENVEKNEQTKKTSVPTRILPPPSRFFESDRRRPIVNVARNTHTHTHTHTHSTVHLLRIRISFRKRIRSTPIIH